MPQLQLNTTPTSFITSRSTTTTYNTINAYTTSTTFNTSKTTITTYVTIEVLLKQGQLLLQKLKRGQLLLKKAIP